LEQITECVNRQTDTRLPSCDIRWNEEENSEIPDQTRFNLIATLTGSTIRETG
jgi:hypothetical protein